MFKKLLDELFEDKEKTKLREELAYMRSLADELQERLIESRKQLTALRSTFKRHSIDLISLVSMLPAEFKEEANVLLGATTLTVGDALIGTSCNVQMD